MTTEELQSLCTEWQKRLRLQDWDVDIAMRRGRDMPLQNVVGCCDWTLSKRMATIRILDPIDYPPDTPFAQDIERTVVHELIHLHFAPFMGENDMENLEYIAKEQAIDTLAGALVTLKRNGT